MSHSNQNTNGTVDSQYLINILLANPLDHEYITNYLFA